MPSDAQLDVLDANRRGFRPGQDTVAATNRFVNAGDEAGMVHAEVAEVNPDGSVAASLCHKSIRLDPGQAGFLVYNEVPTAPPPDGGNGGGGGGGTGDDRFGPVPDPPDEDDYDLPIPPLDPHGFRQPNDRPGPPDNGPPGNGPPENGGPPGGTPGIGRRPEERPPVDVCMAQPANGNAVGEIRVVLPADSAVRFGFRVWGSAESTPPFPAEGEQASNKAASWTASSGGGGAIAGIDRKTILVGALAVGAILYLSG